jgi:hypothetical protein
MRAYAQSFVGFGALAALALVAAQGCVNSAQLASDCDADGGACHALDLADASGAVNTSLPGAPEQLTGIDSIDLLLVIDDSPGMAPHQLALAAQIPAFVERLLRGDLDGGGFPEFHPLSEVRAAVVASNRNIGSVLAPECRIRGEQLISDNAAPECGGAHPALMRFTPGDGGTLGAELACAVQLGGNSCGVSQPLEAMVPGLNALRVAQGGPWAENSIQLVIVVTDQEDCSTEDAQLFAPDERLDPLDPLRGVPDALRCARNPQRLSSVSRYTAALQALRPGATDRVLWAAIAGFPAARVSPAVYRDTPFELANGRAAFYSALSGDARMQYGDVLGPGGRVGNACGALPEATPALRLVELAQARFEDARLGSLCAPLEDALLPLMQMVADTVGLAGL